jgi:hypothetical protein
MKKLGLLISAAAIVGFAGMASAGEPQGHAYGHGCQTSVGPANNPGQAFQNFKNSNGFFMGLNPKEIAEGASDVPSGKVNDLINLICDNSPD